MGGLPSPAEAEEIWAELRHQEAPLRRPRRQHPDPHRGPQAPRRGRADHRITDWVQQVNDLRRDRDAPFRERLARVHNDFEKIHPFLDGNCRSGRLLLNLLLVCLGHPPAIVFENERGKYLAAMRKADAGDSGPLGEVVARDVTNNPQAHYEARQTRLSTFDRGLDLGSPRSCARWVVRRRSHTGGCPHIDQLRLTT